MQTQGQRVEQTAQALLAELVKRQILQPAPVRTLQDLVVMVEHNQAKKINLLQLCFRDLILVRGIVMLEVIIFDA
jgi:hypothetical protein